MADKKERTSARHEDDRYMHIEHPIKPLYDAESRILILGSFPSVKSREVMFFYGHPQNRYWRLIAEILGEEKPETVEEKAAMMHKYHIAMWDVIGSCDIIGSSDTSIKNVKANDLGEILNNSKITRIYVNGGTAEKFYKKYTEKVTGIKAVRLPSTSPANAAWQMERLKEAWKVIKDHL